MWLDLNSPIRNVAFQQAFTAVLEPKSLGEFIKVDKFDSSHSSQSESSRGVRVHSLVGISGKVAVFDGPKYQHEYYLRHPLNFLVYELTDFPIPEIPVYF